MWILFSNENGGGFASVVAKDAAGKPSGPGEDAILSVRFRRAEDAAKLFPGKPYVPTPHGDYAGRVFATRFEVAQVLAREALTMNYDNFKSSLPKSDAAIYNACMSGWTVFGKLQPGGPYGRSGYRDARQGSFAGESWSDYNTAYRTRVVPGIPKGGKAKRRDPFCDGCGMRFGAAALHDGFCDDCVRLADQVAAAEAGSEGTQVADACWSCGLTMADLPMSHRINEFGLCPDCVIDYADAGFTDAEIAEERRLCDEMSAAHEKGV
jgi:hypothetical protein